MKEVGVARLLPHQILVGPIGAQENERSALTAKVAVRDRVLS